jgi:hypothetical protein
MLPLLVSPHTYTHAVVSLVVVATYWMIYVYTKMNNLHLRLTLRVLTSSDSSYGSCCRSGSYHYHYYLRYEANNHEPVVHFEGLQTATEPAAAAKAKAKATATATAAQFHGTPWTSRASPPRRRWPRLQDMHATTYTLRPLSTLIYNLYSRDRTKFPPFFLPSPSYKHLALHR